MEQLDPDKFFRTNRQTIINIESIVKIEPYFQNKVIVHIKPEHKEKILVSKEKWASFKLWRRIERLINRNYSVSR